MEIAAASAVAGGTVAAAAVVESGPAVDVAGAEIGSLV
jgi:hypothetical protein